MAPEHYLAEILRVAPEHYLAEIFKVAPEHYLAEILKVAPEHYLAEIHSPLTTSTWFLSIILLRSLKSFL